MKVISFFIITISLYGMSSCAARGGANTQDSVRAVRISYTLPLLSDSLAIFYDNRNDIVYSYKDFIVHQVESVYDSSVGEVTPDGDVINQRSVKREIRPQYFVYKKGEAFGYKFTANSADMGKKMSLRDFIAERMILQLDTLWVYTSTQDSLVDRSTAGTTLLEKFVPRKKLNAAYADSTFFYYSSDSGLRACNCFSFSRSADNAKKMKLYKIRMIYNANPNTTDVYGKLARQFSFEIQPYAVEHKKDILALIHRLPN